MDYGSVLVRRCMRALSIAGLELRAHVMRSRGELYCLVVLQHW